MYRAVPTRKRLNSSVRAQKELLYHLSLSAKMTTSIDCARIPLRQLKGSSDETMAGV